MKNMFKVPNEQVLVHVFKILEIQENMLKQLANTS